MNYFSITAVNEDKDNFTLVVYTRDEKFAEEFFQKAAKSGFCVEKKRFPLAKHDWTLKPNYYYFGQELYRKTDSWTFYVVGDGLSPEIVPHSNIIDEVVWPGDYKEVAMKNLVGMETEEGKE